MFETNTWWLMDSSMPFLYKWGFPWNLLWKSTLDSVHVWYTQCADHSMSFYSKSIQNPDQLGRPCHSQTTWWIYCCKKHPLRPNTSSSTNPNTPPKTHLLGDSACQMGFQTRNHAHPLQLMLLGPRLAAVAVRVEMSLPVRHVQQVQQA
jgi:hypothetical protein